MSPIHQDLIASLAFGGNSYTNIDNANDDGHYLQSVLNKDETELPKIDDYLVRSEFAAVLYNRNLISSVATPYFGHDIQKMIQTWILIGIIMKSV